MSRWPITAAVLVFVAAAAFAQSSRFQPGANPMSNQGYDAAALLVGTAIPATRAIYNGNATACNFTVTMNGGGSVQLQNNQPGTYNPIQATIVTASTCSAGALIAIW